MDIVDPRVDPKLVPDGSFAVVIGRHQAEYRSLPSIVTPDDKIITRWSPTDEERMRLVRGEDIYITIQSSRHDGKITIAPMYATVGVVDWTRD